MRSAERDGKSVFSCHNAAWFVPRSEGGCDIDSDKKCGKAAFLYVPHSAVVIRFESAGSLRTREGEDESDPPQNGGACDLL